MTEIYIKRKNGEVMEVVNWDTLTDYGAVITRPLSESERDRYFSLKKTLNMRDSEIWRVFHPSGLTPPPPPPPPLPPEEVKIGSCELSKRALLHIIRKACGRDIEPLQHLALDDLQALAANVVLPKEGVPVRVMPIMPQSA